VISLFGETKAYQGLEDYPQFDSSITTLTVNQSFEDNKIKIGM
jgi:hypothetical protein